MKENLRTRRHFVVAKLLSSPWRMTEMNPEKETSDPRRRFSCTACFDALWFCYSPVHQMQQYYRLGVLDNCSGKWSALYDCLTLKTKQSSEALEILQTREKAKPHIWTFRTPEEASSHWKELFGDIYDMEWSAYKLLLLSYWVCCSFWGSGSRLTSMVRSKNFFCW